MRRSSFHGAFWQIAYDVLGISRGLGTQGPQARFYMSKDSKVPLKTQSFASYYHALSTPISISVALRT